MNRRSFACAAALGAAAPAAQASLPKAKITRIRYYRTPTDAAGRPNTHQPLFNQSSNVVVVETDAGLVGILRKWPTGTPLEPATLLYLPSAWEPVGRPRRRRGFHPSLCSPVRGRMACSRQVDRRERLRALRERVASAFPQTAMSAEEKAALSEREHIRLREFGGYDVTAGRSLVVMDRHSGSVKWTLNARYGFIHNAITASDRVLFCLDRLPPALEKRLQRRGRQAPSGYRVLALDLETGRVLSERNTGVFGSWLSYSQEQGRILQATRPSRDMATDETGERMAVYVASSGTLVWDRPVNYNNPPSCAMTRLSPTGPRISWPPGSMTRPRTAAPGTWEASGRGAPPISSLRPAC